MEVINTGFAYRRTTLRAIDWLGGGFAARTRLIDYDQIGVVLSLFAAEFPAFQRIR